MPETSCRLPDIHAKLRQQISFRFFVPDAVRLFNQTR
ncbi:hypothetical protein LTSEMON_4310, partial [Salmonella enterica subsp. enterica serovar Montevideo str. S5-403]